MGRVSVSKAFLATVVLQLVHEHRAELHTPVQHCLPGLLPAEYPDIRISHLLTYTSGLPGESGPDVIDTSTPELVLAHRYDRRTPDRLLATVTRTKRLKFLPGVKQEYRGVNFLLLALLVERLTGRPYGSEIDRRLVQPLGLGDTSVPRGDDPYLHGPHVHGCIEMPDGRWEDATVYNQLYAYGDGV
ncbi:serine hydrolase domain-containing protein [Streptomyces sp. NPDC058239]|uniref:serine hydrolase domain-containing protein n=1 Tax=unclassified Streptomyces TaxID=2593676 RepID=UPI0036504290